MSTSTPEVSSHKELNKHICEASGCFAEAKIKIRVTAGKFGIVTLFVCPGCVGKFAD